MAKPEFKLKSGWLQRQCPNSKTRRFRSFPRPPVDGQKVAPLPCPLWLGICLLGPLTASFPLTGAAGLFPRKAIRKSKQVTLAPLFPLTEGSPGRSLGAPANLPGKQHLLGPHEYILKDHFCEMLIFSRFVFVGSTTSALSLASSRVHSRAGASSSSGLCTVSPTPTQGVLLEQAHAHQKGEKPPQLLIRSAGQASHSKPLRFRERKGSGGCG